MVKRRFAVKVPALLVLLVAASGTSSFARDHQAKILGRSCHETTLKVNIYNGQIIRTNDGYVFHVGVFDQFDTEFWSVDDDLSICATKVMADGRVATHYTLKDLYSPGEDPDGKHVKLVSGPDTK